jgi:uncharacterized protein
MDFPSHDSTRHSAPHSGRTLVIMAKAPKPGMVKTRLAKSLPPHAIVELYRCLLKDTVELARSLQSVEVAVMCPVFDEDELSKWLGNQVRVVAQAGKGLAAGLTSVFRHFTAAGSSEIIAFNSDSPHLSPAVLEEAFGILSTHDVVIGPTDDGGYYLVGAKTAHPSLFEGDGMGTGRALSRLLARTKILELSPGFTQTFYDIDVASDLTRLEKDLRNSPSRAPRTAAWLAQRKQTRDESKLSTGDL